MLVVETGTEHYYVIDVHGDHMAELLQEVVGRRQGRAICWLRHHGTVRRSAYTTVIPAKPAS